MDETCIVTIGGDLGSGKSTVARQVAEQLGTTIYSTGGLQRRMAASLGLTSLELNKRAETDPMIDRQIDGSTVDIAAQDKRVVFDSRLAWHFVPDAFKVYLTVDPVVGAKRILDAKRGKVEEYETLEEAMTRLTERRASEDKRFGEIYGVHMNQLSNYHLVVDTSKNGAEAIVAEVVRHLERWQAGEPYGRGTPLISLHPTTPFPSYDVWSDASLPLSVLRVGRSYYWQEASANGITKAAVQEAIVQNAPLITAVVTACDDDPLESGLTAREWVEQAATLTRSYAWESATGFHYPSYPQHFSNKAG